MMGPKLFVIDKSGFEWVRECVSWWEGGSVGRSVGGWVS